MPWTISRQVEPSRPGVDANGWIWEIERGGETWRLMVEIMRAALAVDEQALPAVTATAIKTEGRSQVEEVLDGDPAPRDRLRSRGLPRTAADECPVGSLGLVADRDEILAYAAELLGNDEYPDYGPMGMQVAGASEVERLVCGVSASLELFERAGRPAPRWCSSTTACSGTAPRG